MKRIFLSCAITIVALCSMALADYPARTKVLFTINVPYKVMAAKIVVPAGNYDVRDLGIAPNAVLSLTQRGKTEPLAILYCVRIDRRLKNWTDEVHVVFDLEKGMPIMKKFFIPAEDGYEIISAVGNKKYAEREEINFTTPVILIPNVEQPKKEEPPPVVAPKVEIPTAEPSIEPTPEPTPQVPVPIKERKRVRKD